MFLGGLVAAAGRFLPGLSLPGLTGSRDPVIAGTRVPLSRILSLLKEGFTLEAIHEEYPHISTEALSGAIDEAIAVLKHTLHAKKVSQI